MSVLDNLQGNDFRPASDACQLWKANESRFFLTLAAGYDMQVLRFTAADCLNTPWVLELTLVSEQAAINPEVLLGTPAIFMLVGSHGNTYFHGQVWQFRRQSQGTRLTQYQLVMRPTLSWLSLGQNQRIFQHKSVPDIIKQLFQEHHIDSEQVQWRLNAVYAPREYCVQYGESNLQFITRLLGEEGIHYHFEHDEHGSRLILADHSSGWSDRLLVAQYKPGTGQIADEETLQSFCVRHAVGANMTSQRVFDLHQPQRRLDVVQYASSGVKSGSEVSNLRHLNHYVYQSDEYHTEAVQRRVRQHLEALQKEQISASGNGNLSQLYSGGLLSITRHSRTDVNACWLLTEVKLRGEQPQVLEEFSNGQATLCSDFTAIPVETSWRPDCALQKPRLGGVQTATVTGPAGDDIYTDALGRVKVQFHWDREERRDERTSCWIRVMQDWAGNGYGVTRLPRIGQEVQVSFEEGDPDKPLITGCLHNGAKILPWQQPEHMTRSGIRTCSSPDGKGTNELRFEDKKGQEELRWQAEKDWDAKILGCSHSQLDGSHARTIGGDDYREVRGEQHITLEAQHQKVIKQNQHGTIHGNHAQHIQQTSLIQAEESAVWRSEARAIYHAGAELVLQAGGSFIKLDPGGITLSGSVVTLNQGGGAFTAGSETAVLPHRPAGVHSSGSGNIPQTRAPEPVEKRAVKAINEIIYSD
jgi:Rhs element Vgr protein